MQELNISYNMDLLAKYLNEDESLIDLVEWKIKVYFEEDPLIFFDWEGEIRFDQLKDSLPADASDETVKAKVVEVLTQEHINKVLEDNRYQLESQYIKSNRTQAV